MTEPNQEHRSTLLIIEDDLVALDSYARVLQASGYHVLTAENVTTGLALIESTTPDAVLLDWHLPIFNGLVFLRQIRAAPHHADTPVAIVTGDYFLDESIEQELHRLGASVHFKPIWEADMLRIAADLVGGDDPSSSS